MAKTKKVRSQEVTFEGKNIHFSPLDNKPLCSFSNKLCRQRRLNGYAFCIRHILEDKSSPFKQCDYVTRNNSQRCLNAIPSNQERGYCHSHMQVAGIIPKTERKVKPMPGGPNSSHGSTTAQNDSDSKKENKKKVSLPTDNHQSLPGPVLPATNGKAKKQQSPTSKSKGKCIPTRTPILDKPKVNAKEFVSSDDFPALSNAISRVISLPKNGKTPVKNKDPTKKQTKSKAKMPGLTQLNQQDNLGTDVANHALNLHFEQLKTLNISDFPRPAPIPDAKLVKSELMHLNIPANSPVDRANLFLLNPPHFQLYKKQEDGCLINHGNGKCSETRQEFLSRVRSAFKSHYKMFQKAYKLSESQDDDKTFSESLISCVLTNPRKSTKSFADPQIESSCKIEEKLADENDQGSHSSSMNCQSNNNINSLTSSRILLSPHHNGEISYLNSIVLKNFDENLASDHFKESKFCDSSPWMNGGINDLPLGSLKKGRNYNPMKQNQHLTQSGFAHGMMSKSLSTTTSPSLSMSNGFANMTNRNGSNCQSTNGIHVDNDVELDLHSMKKRRLDLQNEFDDLERNLDLDLHVGNTSHLLCPSHYSSVAHFESVLNSVSSSDTAGTPEGVITDASFDSPFDHSTSSQPDCDFSDDVDDLEKTFELQIDPEIAHQASRLLENNELTEDDFNELFPETRSLSDHKLGTDLGIDFTTTFDADIDYSLFANIFPNFRSNNSSEGISVTNNF